MDVLKADEYYSLADEKFDFDMSLSPDSSRGEEEQEDDGVFVAGLGVSQPPLSGGEEPSFSPSLTDCFERISQEANSLASRLAECPHQEEVGGGESSLQSSPLPHLDPPVEQFVQDPRDKMGLLSLARPSSALSPIKRETFCVRDSPLKLLPPALQTRLLAPPATRPRSRLSTASPAGPQTRTQTRMSLRGKTGLGVLPNKPLPPSTLSGPQRSGPADRPGRFAPPGKGALGPRRGSSRAGSCEDLLSDTASVASDTSDCSLDSSLQGRRARAPPPGKAPPTSTRKGVETRRHASTSSLTSGLSASLTGKPSPGGPRTRRSVMLGKAAEPPAAPAPTTAGARRSLSTTLRRPSEVGARPPSVGGRSTPVKRAEPGTPLSLTPAKRLMEKAPSPRTSLAPSSRPSLAPSTRPSLAPSSRLSLASSSKPSLASSSKPSQASSSRLSQASSSKPSQASSSRPSQASSRPQQQPGTRVKPRAPVVPVAPTPTQLRRLAGPEGVSTPDAPSIKNPKKLVTTCSLDGLPQRAEPPSTPASTCGGAGQQWRPQRSALPTPSGRRLSFLPTMTPRSLPRPAQPARPSCAPPGAPEQEEEEEEEEVFASEIQPFSLEEEEETAPGPPPPTQGSNQQREEKENQEKEEEEEDKHQEREEEKEKEKEKEEEGEGEEEEEEEEEKEKENQADLMELQSVEDLLSTTQHNKNQELMEFPLVDVPAPVRRPDEKLLIDLSNTPDLVRNHSAKPCGGQLIDLSSPLIKWSPEEKQGNTGVLVNISF
ncbi:G2 and S phase-expressed protein 1 isoform X2 [Gadus chalcogrammus]|uniref:G2 and S phase-expressed protein 1 isoform X2 n=1 Tax=Gadus chalcogrammus TaxID=1042646 RepID=UPI0024C4A3B7|nr:G2 and S phase-expressed protein 1 isoform X2 [Gadus chalcogrammus]